MKTFLFAGLGLLTIWTIFLITRSWSTDQENPVSIISQGPTVERLERLSHLVTTRVYVADVLTGTGDGYRGAWLIRGDALIAVNLSQASIPTKDYEAKQAVICLPPPEVLQARVDHTRTKTWAVEKTTWVPWGGDADALRDAVMLHAQRLVAQAAGSAVNLDQAKSVAEVLIRSFYEEFGWRVRVTWADDAPQVPLHEKSEPASDVADEQQDDVEID